MAVDFPKKCVVIRIYYFLIIKSVCFFFFCHHGEYEVPHEQTGWTDVVVPNSDGISRVWWALRRHGCTTDWTLVLVLEGAMLSKIKIILDFPSQIVHNVQISHRSSFSSRFTHVGNLSCMSPWSESPGHWTYPLIFLMIGISPQGLISNCVILTLTVVGHHEGTHILFLSGFVNLSRLLFRRWFVCKSS